MVIERALEISRFGYNQIEQAASLKNISEIKFCCSDSVICSIPVAIAYKWPTIRSIIEDVGIENLNKIIDLPNVASHILIKIQFWTKIQLYQMPNKQFFSFKLSNMDNYQGHLWAILSRYNEATLTELLLAANYLKVSSLYNFGIRALVFKLLQRLNSDQIKMAFAITYFDCQPCAKSFYSWKLYKEHYEVSHANFQAKCCGTSFPKYIEVKDWDRRYPGYWYSMKEHFANFHGPDPVYLQRFQDYAYDEKTNHIHWYKEEYIKIHGPNPKQFNVDHESCEKHDWLKVDGWFLWEHNGALVHFIDQLNLVELPHDLTKSEIRFYVFKRLQTMTSEEIKKEFNTDVFDCCGKSFNSWEEFKNHYEPIHFSCNMHSCDVFKIEKQDENEDASSDASSDGSSDTDESEDTLTSDEEESESNKVHFMCSEMDIVTVDWSQAYQWPGITETLDELNLRNDINSGIFLPEIDESTLKQVIAWTKPLDPLRPRILNCKLAKMDAINGIQNWTNFLNLDYCTLSLLLNASLYLQIDDLFFFVLKIKTFKSMKEDLAMSREDFYYTYDMDHLDCDPCNKHFQSYQQLKDHHMKIHKTCEVLCCGVQYKKWDQLRIHFLSNHYPFEMMKEHEIANKSADQTNPSTNDENNFPWFLYVNNGAAVNFIDQLDEHRLLEGWKKMKVEEYRNEPKLPPKVIYLNADIL